MKRRAVTANKTKDDIQAIAESVRTGHKVSNEKLYPGGEHQNSTGKNYQKKNQQQRPYDIGSNKELFQTFMCVRRDRESTLFLVLAVFGAAFVVIACFAFSIGFEKGNESSGGISSFSESIIFDSNKISIDDDKREYDIATGRENIEFQQTSQTYFVKTSRDANLKLPHGNIPTATGAIHRYFGGLDLDFLKTGTTRTTRQIRNDTMWMLSDYRNYHTVARDDDQDNYYAHDDDYIRNPFMKSDEDNDKEEDEICCRRISEHRLYFPNCNSFHEIPMLESEVTYVGAGTYRQAMRLKISSAEIDETVVVKDIHISNDLEYDAYEFTRMDAIVAERLTSSRRIYSIYGTCGIGIISEYFPHGQVEQIAIVDDDVIIDIIGEEEGPLTCYNDLSGLTKLRMSLDMAEALADLHGYSGGVIVHQDVKLDQFFFNSNLTEIILNDFNRAEFMLWDDCNKKYCGYREGYGMGNWRSPEEYYDEVLNEKVDVFSLGNNMYGLLTGLMVFHDVKDYTEIQHMVGIGERPYIDPRYKERSLAEAKLVDIIEKCHEYYEKDRPSIFEVVELLWEALEEVLATNDEK